MEKSSIIQMPDFILLDGNFASAEEMKKSSKIQMADIESGLVSTESKILDLTDNGISSLEFLRNFPELEKLYLDNNLIIDISELKFLNKLRVLTLSNNKIEDISPLAGLEKLSILKIEKNLIKDITPLKDMIMRGVPVKIVRAIHQKGIHLFDNPINNPPIDIINRGNNSIVKFWNEKIIQGVEKIYEAKLLIVGEGGVGKTSLAKKIKNIDSSLPESDLTTRGIDIEPKYFDILDKNQLNKFRMNVWDFGGQQIYHSTHQFFLTKKSLYVLLMDTRTENHNFDYWLQTIELFSENSPVIILQNIHQGRNVQFDERGIKSRFLNIKDIISVDLKNEKTKTEKLISTIQFHIQNLKHIGEELPKQWVTIRKAIEGEAKNYNYIAKERFFEICSLHTIKERDRQLFLSQYLHDLGVILHFQNETGLDNLVVLNNIWATDAVYKVLDYLNTLNVGEFTQNDWIKIWNDPIYIDKHTELVSLMKKFELCYQIENTNRFIVPKCLPKSEPDLKVDGIIIPNNEKIISVKYDYDFMPKGIIPRFIVRMHHRIKSQDLVWATGVVLQERNTIAIIKEQYADRVINIIVWGSNAQSFISKIIDNIDAIHSSFNSTIRVKKLIPCNCHICSEQIEKHYFDYHILMRAQELSKEIQCQISFDSIQPSKLLDNTFKQPEKLKKIFFSYSHMDEDIKKTIDKHLSSLKRSKKIETWDDRQIIAGDNWDDSIRAKINEADIILLLISANFNSSDYIWNNELEKAIERHNRKDCIVLPIFARECDFEDTPYAKLQGLPRDTKFIFNAPEREQDKLCVEVSRGIRNIIEN